MANQRAPLIPDGGLSRREFLRLTGAGAAAVAAGAPALTHAAGRLAQPAGSPQRGAVPAYGLDHLFVSNPVPGGPLGAEPPNSTKGRVGGMLS